MVGGLELLARHAESTGHVHPYKWEDWLRFLVPTLWAGHDAPTLMLTGPSTARENFLAADFSSAFPGMRVSPCAMSLGTFRDITAALEYIERAYGQAALPEVVVLGISPRFMAEIPRERPFSLALERYTRHFGPLTDSSAAFGLARKPAVEGITDHLRFKLTHQSGRYRSAMAWATTRVLSPRVSSWISESAPARFLAHSSLGRALDVEQLALEGPYKFALRYIAPYRYQPALTAMPHDALAAALDDPRSWWGEVFRWNPAIDAAALRARTAALIDWTSRRGIELHVVRLPEHSYLRERTDPVLSARFDSLIATAFDPVPVLDLKCLLPDSLFLDAEHALWPGAKQISAHVIEYMSAVRQHRAHAPRDRVVLRILAGQWSRRDCAVDG